MSELVSVLRCAPWRGRGSDERSSVEEDGVRVSVGNVRHVLQDVLFSDDSQQPPKKQKKTQRLRFWLSSVKKGESGWSLSLPV